MLIVSQIEKAQWPSGFTCLVGDCSTNLYLSHEEQFTVIYVQVYHKFLREHQMDWKCDLLTHFYTKNTLFTTDGFATLSGQSGIKHGLCVPICALKLVD